jgi:hypothetical protein
MNENLPILTFEVPRQREGDNAEIGQHLADCSLQIHALMQRYGISGNISGDLDAGTLKVRVTSVPRPQDPETNDDPALDTPLENLKSELHQHGYAPRDDDPSPTPQADMDPFNVETGVLG